MPRAKEFDPDETLDKAMRLFWAKGYHDTSIRDLVARTGVNYYGLYDVWDSKHGLFLAALDHYRETITSEVVGELRTDGPVADRLRAAFERLTELMTTRDGRVGCMMCNTAVELSPHDDAARDKVSAHLAQLGAAFTAALERAQAAGESHVIADTRDAGDYLATTAYTLGLLLRAGADATRVRRHIDRALAAVL